MTHCETTFNKGIRRYFALMTAACVALCGCVPLAGRDSRAADPSLTCMQRVRDEKLPVGLDDEMKHCMAAGLIARYCSRTEAWMASYGKEIKDIFGSGDAQWRDIEADGRGVSCAREVSSDAQLRECCTSSTAKPRSGAAAQNVK